MAGFPFKQFLLALCAVLPAPAADGGLTAEELARHLHVFYWVTKIDLHGHQWRIDVVHVQDGKVVSTLLSDEAFPTDRPFERIVILADQTPLGTKVSIQPGASAKMSMSREVASETVPMTMTTGMADEATEGDYFLAGVDNQKLFNATDPSKIEDVKDGLVLRLHQKQ